MHRSRWVAACGLGLAGGHLLIAAAQTPDRVAVTIDGSALTGTSGGGGAALGWLHNFDSQTIGEISAEHRILGNAQWTLGGLDGSLTRGSPNARYTLYVDAREGGGVVGGRNFDYSVVDAGVIGSFGRRWSVQIEERQIDVQTTHGSLPKLGVTYQLGQRVLASVAYAYSVGGNLGTRLYTLRIQDAGMRLAPVVGIALGQAAPQVLDLQTGIALPGRTLREGYAGMTVPVPSRRGELMVLADYVDLSASRRATLSLTYTFHVGPVAAPAAATR